MPPGSDKAALNGIAVEMLEGPGIALVFDTLTPGTVVITSLRDGEQSG